MKTAVLAPGSTLMDIYDVGPDEASRGSVPVQGREPVAVGEPGDLADVGQREALPTASLRAERRAVWSLGLGLAGVVGALLVIAKIMVFTSSGYTLIWGAVAVLGLGALIAGVAAWSDGRFSGRAKLGMAIGTAIVVFSFWSPWK